MVSLTEHNNIINIPHGGTLSEDTKRKLMNKIADCPELFVFQVVIEQKFDTVELVAYIFIV